VPTRCDPKFTVVGDSVTAGAVPVPLSAMDCGLPPASSVIWAFAARTPVAVGENVTVIVHVAFTASVPGQSFVWAKSPAFAPTIVMPVMVSGAVPVSFSVDSCEALVVPTRTDPKPRLAGVSVTAGAGVTPVPPSVTLSGLLAALSTIDTVATRLPPSVGEKVTDMVHVPFTASVAGQSFVCPKSAALVPVVPMLVIVSTSVPVFFTIEDCDALVEPTSCDANVRLVGVSITAGAGVVPLPLSGMVWGVPGASSAMLTLAARPPETVGENVTVIVHVAFAASEPGQLFDCPKSPALAPVRPMLVIVIGPVPVFLSVDD